MNEDDDDDIPELVDLDSVFLIPKAIDLADADPLERVIPITILTGFLGAGKRHALGVSTDIFTLVLITVLHCMS